MIPIAKLTDADVKWMLTAEYGGSGGKKLETGMVVEEPDIEIGAGVSSKGMVLLTKLDSIKLHSNIPSITHANPQRSHFPPHGYRQGR